jgi:predicted ATPase/DNA-binding NarL/FixJ family response regulator
MAGRAARSRLGNLPTELTSFVGRRRELAEVKRLLTTTHLLTLTGSGGVGKTRLAVRAASEMARNFPDGVWLVSLAPIDDPLLISQSVFSALGLQDVSSRWSLSVLSDYLRKKRLLLVLDNCEHLLDGSAGLAGTLLKSCSELRILATSRQALGMAGETRFRVPPLTLPAGATLLTPSQIAGFDAVALLTERAAAVQRGFTVDESNAAQVLQLCRRLDGLPLALELAAARLEGLTVDQLLAGLDRDLSVPVTPLRGGEARQRTIQATLDWSYSLLDEKQQRLWARVSVFAGGFDAEAATKVCSDAEVPGEDVPTVLAALVESSILQRDTAFKPPRYVMLETVRHYGWQKLREIGEELRLQTRHRDWALELAAQVGAFDQRQAEMLNRVHMERNNIWSALDFCLRQPGEAAKGADICRHIWIYWVSRGPVGYARRVVTSLLEATTEDGPPRCRLLWVAGSLALAQNDSVAGEALSEECLVLARRLNDQELVAWALICQLGARLLAGQLTAAIELAESALDLGKVNDLQPIVLGALTALCVVKLSTGDLDGAVKLGEEALDLSQRLGELWFRGNMFNYLSQASLQRGELGRADELLRESATSYLALSDRQGLSNAVETLAWTAAERAAYERAAILLGSAESLRESVGSAVPAFFRPQHDRAMSAASVGLGERAFASAFQRGGLMATEEAVAYGVGSRTLTKRAPRSEGEPQMPLTDRELEIARLIAEGLTNKEVASKLFISNRTVETHVTNMLNKLGLSSRTQLARWVG